MAETHDTSPDNVQLEGWKAIAAYLNRDVRTAKRWEVSEALPVRRHRHAARSSVYAYPSEIDAWRESRRPDLRSQPPVDRGRRLRAVLLAPLMLAGGGYRMGQVIGQSDRYGGEPNSDPVRIQNLVSTVMHTLFDVGELRLVRGVPNEVIRASSAEPIALGT